MDHQEAAQTETAASLYERLSSCRDAFLDRGRKAAALTIPMLLPRTDVVRGAQQTFDTPHQGMGARGVNHLASRLLLTLLPPNSPFFKLDIPSDALAEIPPESGIHAEIEASLRKVEETVQRHIETHSMRVAGAEIFKHLVVAGNACMFVTKNGSLSYFPLSHYVVERDAEGDEPVLIVIKETSSLVALPKDVQELVMAYRVNNPQPATAGTYAIDRDVEIYTKVCRHSATKFEVRQELKDGTVIPDTVGTYTSESLPIRPLRWTKVKGEAYGRGLVEEYHGDLMALESLSKALVDGALAAARVVGLVAPNGSTHPADLNKARNGEFVRGRGDDIQFVQLQKFADFRTAQEAAARIERRLESAFLLNSSAIRDAERVTAEEVRFSAQELESALGGVYSILAQEFQMPLVSVILKHGERGGKIPKLPKSILPMIVTGVAAMGRFADLERLRMALGILKETLGPEAVAGGLNPDPLFKYVFAQTGVKIEGIVKSAEQRAQEAQQAQQMQMLQSAIDKGVGPGINAMSGATMQQNELAASAPPEGE